MTPFNRHVLHLRDRPEQVNIDDVVAIAHAESQRHRSDSSYDDGPSHYAWNRILNELVAIQARNPRAK